MTGVWIRIMPLALALALGLGACDRGDEMPPMDDVHGEMPMEGMQGMQGMDGMSMDREMMRRHAQEADSMASVMRQHVDRMRQLSPEQWHDRMGEHVGQASQMLGLMNRQMREMDMGMGMSDEQMGQMMGMSGEEHRGMMEEMRALRTDLEQLQTASPEQVRDRMPAHLDRLERMVETMEASAEHMRSM